MRNSVILHRLNKTIFNLDTKATLGHLPYGGCPNRGSFLNYALFITSFDKSIYTALEGIFLGFVCGHDSVAL